MINTYHMNLNGIRHKSGRVGQEIEVWYGVRRQYMYKIETCLTGPLLNVRRPYFQLGCWADIEKSNVPTQFVFLGNGILGKCVYHYNKELQCRAFDIFSSRRRGRSRRYPWFSYFFLEVPLSNKNVLCATLIK